MKDKLEELRLKMLEVIVEKMEIENVYFLDKQYYGDDKARPYYIYYLNEADVKGYNFSLEFNKLKNKLVENDELKFEEIHKYSDPILIETDYIFNKYGITHPEFCILNRFSEKDILYDKLENDYIKSINKIDNLYDSNIISEFEYSRLCRASQYYYDIVTLKLDNSFLKLELKND